MKKILFALFLVPLFFASCENNNKKNVQPEDPDAQYTVFPEGFIALDGFDEATGRYRINVFPSSQPIGDAVGAYTDIVLFLYTLTPPTDSTISVGEAQPFSPTGANMSNEILYNPGLHFENADGVNMAGSGWWKYDENHDLDDMLASHIGNQNITFDEEKREYTFRGVMIDTIKMDTLKYKFTTKNEFLIINQ